MLGAQRSGQYWWWSAEGMAEGIAGIQKVGNVHGQSMEV